MACLLMVVLFSFGWVSSCQAFHVGNLLSSITSKRTPLASEGRVKIFGRIMISNSSVRDTRILSRKDEDYDPSSDDGEDDSFPLMVVALPLVALAALWPLLAIFRDANDPTSGFDIDMFMALKGILDSGNGNDAGGMMVLGDDSIIELPPLSPAEQLVGAIFGPP